ncbi:MAG: hypothetical protein ABFS56_13350 [Pseudomonadota bacterium]
MLLAKTIETTGIVNNPHQLLLDESLPITETSRVRVIVIVTEAAPVAKSKTTLAHHHTLSEISNRKKLHNLPAVFYTPIKKSKYHQFNREEIYNG